MMIRVNQIHKHYNLNKKNALHVLNDVSLTFEEKGLIVLLGQSGSGKTTLLNVIGGMDGWHQGSIAFDEQEMKHYTSRAFDALRREKIGMIFQNYYLLPNLSVYENIALTLRMIGVTNHHALDRRIDYLLEQVRMLPYKKRLASQLSGGQQQRVAIARALAKQPYMILADEPTGNLDSKNTLETMQIIKDISKNKLVILVTHERHLAKAFADRIIEIEDGQIISDQLNKGQGIVDRTTETDIYLEDLTHQSSFKDEKITIDYFQDTVTKTPLKARLVMKNRTLYLDIQQEELKKIHVLDDQSEIVLHEAKHEKPTEYEPVNTFEYDTVVTEKDREKPQRIIQPKAIALQTMRKLVDATRGAKMLYIGFAIGAMIIAWALSNLLTILTVDEEAFLVLPKETIAIYEGGFDYDTFSELTHHPAIDNVVLNYQNTLTINLPSVIMSGFANPDEVTISTALIDHTRLREDDIIYGELPTSPYDIVLDASFVKKHIFMNHMFYALDITTYDEVLHLTIKSLSSTHDTPHQIVGISDLGAPVAYLHPDLLLEAFTGDFLSHGQLVENEITITEGRPIENDGEILLHDSLSGEYQLGQTHHIHSIQVDIVGFYTFHDETIDVLPTLVDTDTLKRVQFAQNEIIGLDTVHYVYANNVNEAINHLESLGYTAEHIYASERAAYLERALLRQRSSLVFSGVALFATALSFYFIIRSSMANRIYEIGVYRSLGVRKQDIIKRFLIESAVITTFSSLIGLSIMNYIIYSAQNAVGDFFVIGHVSLLSVFAGIVLIYSVSLLSGAIPVALLLRKTPAQINTQYDL